MYRERNWSLKQTMMRGRRAGYDEFWALRNVSFEIPAGSTFGLIGENGSGKSTLLKCIARILRPDSGQITSHGKLAALLELGSGFHPELSGRENVYLNGAILGLNKKELDRRFDGIVDFAGVERFIDQPVKSYSSGMYVRLGFSVAINVDPDILLVDEVLAVGDEAFQRKCMAKFAEYRASGRTVVLVSHAMGQMRHLCDNIAWLDKGELREVGRPGVVVDDYVDDAGRDNDGVSMVRDLEIAQPVESRSGSGEIRIDRVELLDSGGGPIARPLAGAALTVRLHYRSAGAADAPVFGVELTTPGDPEPEVPLIRETESLERWAGGEGYVDLRMSRLPLTKGVFDLSVSISDHTAERIIDRRQRVLRFAVDSPAHEGRGGLMAVDGTWHHHATPTGAVGATEPADNSVTGQ